MKPLKIMFFAPRNQKIEFLPQENVGWEPLLGKEILLHSIANTVSSLESSRNLAVNNNHRKFEITIVVESLDDQLLPKDLAQKISNLSSADKSDFKLSIKIIDFANFIQKKHLDGPADDGHSLMVRSDLLIFKIAELVTRMVASVEEVLTSAGGVVHCKNQKLPLVLWKTQRFQQSVLAQLPALDSFSKFCELLFPAPSALSPLSSSLISIDATDENVSGEMTPFIHIQGLKELEVAEKILRLLKIQDLRQRGVRFRDSATVVCDNGVTCGKFSTIGSNVVIKGTCSIGEGVVIDENVIIEDCIIESGVHIQAFSHISGAKISSGASIGPFARIRPSTIIGQNVKIGNFVEIKKSNLQKGCKVSHLSYVGDAQIGEETNLGCGFITCNYDGKNKYETKIGDHCFIGSDCQMIAPVTLGNNSFVAAGSTITQSLEENSFAIARSKQVTKKGLGKKYIKTRS